MSNLNIVELINMKTFIPNQMVLKYEDIRCISIARM